MKSDSPTERRLVVVRRLELLLVAFSLACLAAVALAQLGWWRLAGTLPLALYPYYTVAVATGWLFGNLYVMRRRSAVSRVALFAVYFFSPVSPIYLVRAMAPRADQLRAPLVPLFAVGVMWILFLVPATLGRAFRKRDVAGRDNRQGPHGERSS